MLRPIAILNNLRRYKNVRAASSLEDVFPQHRRGVVLVLLFIDKSSKLRVLLTKRSRSMRSFAGHVAFPGGKADNKSETFEQIARREAEEEIGLPQDNTLLKEKYGLGIENINDRMPCYLSQTLLSVKPFICFLYNNDNYKERYNIPLDVQKCFGKLNPGETSSVFSIPLLDPVSTSRTIGHIFSKDHYHPEFIEKKRYLVNWAGLKWDVKHFHYLTENSNEVEWLEKVEDLSSDNEIVDNITHKKVKIRDVWGLTARIIYDIGYIGSGFSNNIEDEIGNTLPIEEISDFKETGNEDIIKALVKSGKSMNQKHRNDWEKSIIGNKTGYMFQDIISEMYTKRYV